jgi:DivIVA domain-containing protein
MAGDSEAQEIKARTEPGRKAATRSRTRVPDHEIAEVRDVDFPIAMRGYDRAAVDSYVSRVNRLLAELQITAAPESAIRHALDEVADETRGILGRAHETAEEITRRSRAQADDRLQRGEREAEEVRTAADAYAREIRETAEKHLRALQADAERIWQEREGILTELRALAGQLEQVAAKAADRYPAPPDVDPKVIAAPPPPAEEAPGAGDEDGGEGFPLDDD